MAMGVSLASGCLDAPVLHACVTALQRQAMTDVDDYIEYANCCLWCLVQLKSKPADNFSFSMQEQLAPKQKHWLLP